MNGRRAFNSTMDFVLSRPGYQIRMVACAVGVLLAWRFIAAHDDSIRTESTNDLRDSLAAVTALKWHAKRDTAALHMAKDGVTVTRTVHRLDTLWRAVPETLVTHEDTTAALNALPVLRVSTDSAMHACSELVLSCAQYRVIADSTIDFLTKENQRIHDRAKPSRMAPVVKWAEIAGAAFIGFKLGRMK